MKNFGGLSIILAFALCLVGIVDGYAVFRGLQGMGPGAMREFAILHSGAVFVGGGLVLVFRGGWTLAVFSVLIGFMVPAVGFLPIVMSLFFFRAKKSVAPIEQPFITGNPARYRTAPDSPGNPIEKRAGEERAATIWLRHVDSRDAVLNLQRMRSEGDPFTSLYASGALETQMGHLENRISRLRSQAVSSPEDSRIRRHLAEALINQLSLIDPKIETGEGEKALKEAQMLLAGLGVSSGKLESLLAMRTADQLVRKGDWRKVNARLGTVELPVAVAEFWGGKSPGPGSSLIS